MLLACDAPGVMFVNQATAQGIDATRLRFTALLNRTRHLALKAHAHLLLDTTPYNGHITVVEALWAGLPVLTLPHARMASRVTAANLAALGLGGRLVARSLQDYEDLAVVLARRWSNICI